MRKVFIHLICFFYKCEWVKRGDPLSVVMNNWSIMVGGKLLLRQNSDSKNILETPRH